MASHWDAAGSTIDGDLLGGNSLVNIGPGSDILLATLTFEALAPGTTSIAISIIGDEDEGFALDNLSGLASVASFATRLITVPEPGSLVLFISAATFALCRRRRK